MAEFCRSCAYKIGVEPDEEPLLCEGCGHQYPKMRRRPVTLFFAMAIIAAIVRLIIYMIAY